MIDLSTTEDWIQITLGNYRLMSPNTTLLPNLLTSIRATTFGSGEATTVQKLWIYRVITIVEGGVPVPATTLEIPASRLIMPGVVMKEGDLSYMMRLKRSYELATGP